MAPTDSEETFQLSTINVTLVLDNANMDLSTMILLLTFDCDPVLVFTVIPPMHHLCIHQLLNRDKHQDHTMYLMQYHACINVWISGQQLNDTKHYMSILHTGRIHYTLYTFSS